MLLRGDYTVLRIKKSSLEKINIVNGEKSSVANVIEKLLKNVECCNVDDVVDVKRNPVAIVLEYVVFDNGIDFNTSVYNLTFDELKRSKVGDKLYVNPSSCDSIEFNDKYWNTI